MLSTSLFVLCINDVEENESGTQISKFVDDTNICGTVYKYQSCLRLQQDIDQLENRGREWLMKFNSVKES